MLVRYRYRIDPTAAQRQALARAFGCARVVYNDAIVERQRAYQAGEWVSDTEVQRRVITQAKSLVSLSGGPFRGENRAGCPLTSLLFGR
jgi:transposase